ncbi:hypothetical protein [Hymenobacter sp. CRA2]|uniref:hypothetical protein n=1 Tax=Hymenobacter sp. CRA2 TaxID=1955620 RepID=UPI00098FE4E2|nr:hypothetical protein [Hymenobacter sp. CRA2]OON66958.1 hypothetical protein B0919_20465 [Hymenobacter sp. CRA2]
MLKSPHLRLALAAVTALTLGLGACETTKRGFPESSTPGTESEETAAANPNVRQNKRERKETEDLRILDSPNRLVGAVVESKVQYKVPREILMQNFNRQFSDGTVIDKAQVRPVQGSAKEKPTYFLVGMGLRNGMYRAMAIPLALSTDNELYLSSDAERYVVEGRGCQMCFFNFERGAIVGTTCEDNSGGCNLTIERKNTFFPPKR